MAFCPDNGSFTLKGYWSEDSMKRIIWRVSLCDFDSTSYKCASYDEIMQTIAKIKLILISFSFLTK